MWNVRIKAFRYTNIFTRGREDVRKDLPFIWVYAFDMYKGISQLIY